MILALCPGRVTSNILAKVAGGNAPLSISLTVVTSLLSILTVPLMVAFSVHHFMGEDGPPVNVTQLGITMFLITAVPVAIGMALTAKSPALVEKIAPARFAGGPGSVRPDHRRSLSQELGSVFQQPRHLGTGGGVAQRRDARSRSSLRQSAAARPPGCDHHLDRVRGAERHTRHCHREASWHR